MGVVDDAVEDRVGQSWIANQVVPAVHWDLAGDQGSATSVAVLDDLQQIVALLGGQRFEAQSSRMSSFTPPRARISLA